MTAAQEDRGNPVITSDFDEQLTRWRHHLHQNPETGFNENKTADYIATILGAMGLQVQRGIGGTGIVASLRLGDGQGVIGLPGRQGGDL